MEFPKIPDECDECPVLLHAERDNKIIEEERRLIKGFARAVMRLNPENIQTSDRQNSLEISREDAERATQALRNKPEERFQELDEAEDENTSSAKKIVENCDGQVKMRGKKGGTTYTVTLCGSQETPEGFSCEDAHVFRERDK